MNLAQVLASKAAKYSDKVSIIFDGNQFTFKDIVHNFQRSASLFRHLGISKGDVVAFQLPKSMEFLFMHLGNLSIGGITLPLNTAYKKDEMAYLLNNSRSSLFVTEKENYLYLKPVIDSIKDLNCLIIDEKVEGEYSYGDEIERISNVKEPPYSSRNDDIALIFYTSGTTGQPKGAMITHRNLLENMGSLKKAWEWTEKDVLLHALPIFHVHGLTVALHGCLNAGCKVIIHQVFDPHKVWEDIEKYKCTMFMGVPTMYQRMLKAWQEMPEKPAIDSVRVFISGSAPLPERLFYDFKKHTGHTLLERYGTTETGMNTSNLIEESGRKAKSVGYPLSGVEIRIVDMDRKDVKPPKVGEVWIKGDNIFKGYWRAKEKTAESLEGPWFRTGDMGYQDPEDNMRIYLIGRSKDLIITGGYNVYPKEVEDILERHEGIDESAVIGLPDEDYGEKVIGIVVLKNKNEDVAAEDIIGFCKQRLASYKCPKQIFFRDKLPKNAMGKIQKNHLKSEYSL